MDFFNQDGWQARRLGGSSTGLPDVVATNNSQSVIFSIEAKSTVGRAVYIPNDQIVRCIEILEMFSRYTQRNVVFAFKFAKSKHNPQLKYWLFRFHTYDLKFVKTLKCDSNGKLTYTTLNTGLGCPKLSTAFYRCEDIKILRDMYNAPFSDTL